MGVRFRKSFKIAPGMKLNFGKKGVSATVGGNGAHYTINSSGKKTASVGVPGTGLSYSSSSGGTNSKGKKAAASSNSKASGCAGCFVAFFCVCLAIVALSFILNYAWIPGLIAAIYFARNTQDSKQKKIRVGISIAVTLISFLIFLSTMFAPELTDLTVNWEKQEYEISEEAILDLDIIEEDAEIHSLEISDNDIARVRYADGIATITFINEGTADISFIANGEIKSNVTTITVVDKEAEEQRSKEKAEEEARLKAEEEARLKAKEEARLKAEEEEIVWIPSSGKRYHSNPSCSNMKNPTQVTLSEAKSGNYTPCSRCY